jgi:5'-nucleotidase
LKPLILITNDDSINSKGISVLIEAMQSIGEVVVVAPDSHQSGMGHAITVNDMLRLKKSKVYPNLNAYECSGTPADCVKIAKHELLKDRNIDLVVSGINHGANASISVIYSGTMAAVIEAGVEGIPAIGFSLDDFGSNADFSHTIPFLKSIALKVLEEKDRKLILNVNFPALQVEPIKGIRVCRQNKGNWVEEFEKRTDPNGKHYYWMGGGFQDNEPNDDTNDIWAIKNNYVAIVPVQFDLTNYAILSELKQVF